MTTAAISNDDAPSTRSNTQLRRCLHKIGAYVLLGAGVNVVIACLSVAIANFDRLDDNAHWYRLTSAVEAESIYVLVIDRLGAVRVVTFWDERIDKQLRDHFSPQISGWWESHPSKDPLDNAHYPPPIESQRLGRRISYTVYWTCYTAEAILGSPRSIPSADEVVGQGKAQVGFDSHNEAFWAITIEDAGGFPFPALRARLRLAVMTNHSPYYMHEMTGGVNICGHDVWSLEASAGAHTQWGRWRALPYEPIPSGVIANSVMWAVLIALSAVGAKRVRTKVRTMRGRCGSCGYNRSYGATAKCPECGTQSE